MMSPLRQPVPTPPSPADHPSTSWTDADLLAAIAHPEDPTRAHPAFDVFLERWKTCVAGHVAFMCRLPPAVQIGETHIESETWYTVYRKAASYDAHGLVGEHQTARTAGWLKAIATRALRMCIRRQGDRHLCALSDEALLTRPDIPLELTNHNPRRAIVVRCLQRLSERDADVLRTSAGFITANGTVDGMPTEIRDKLLRRYETTDINLRQIRSRAYRRLKACVEHHLPHDE